MSDRNPIINLSTFTFSQLETAFSTLVTIRELPELLDVLCGDLHQELEARVQLRNAEADPIS